jgi:hypothetical protein
MTEEKPVVTVGDLIDKLREFDSRAPIRVQGALSSEPDFIVGVSMSPDEPGVVAVVYMPPPDES